MPDDTSIADVGVLLKQKNLTFEVVQDGGKKVYVIQEYPIPRGKYAGRIVQLGLPMPPDYPLNAPYGMHVKSNEPFENVTNTGGSFLGTGWQFWSRQITDWSPGMRTAQFYLDHVDRWLEVN